MILSLTVSAMCTLRLLPTRSCLQQCCENMNFKGGNKTQYNAKHKSKVLSLNYSYTLLVSSRVSHTVAMHSGRAAAPARLFLMATVRWHYSALWRVDCTWNVSIPFIKNSSQGRITAPSTVQLGIEFPRWFYSIIKIAEDAAMLSPHTSGSLLCQVSFSLISCGPHIL